MEEGRTLEPAVVDDGDGDGGAIIGVNASSRS